MKKLYMPSFPKALLTAARATVIAVLMAMTAVSCGHSAAHDTLERAEALIDEHEDSALMLLQTIDPASVGSGDDRALYDMLMAQALDKNHMPLPPDSLIEAAARRFIVKGDRLRAMRADYYHGRAKYLKGNYPVAIVMFFRAASTAEELDEPFWAGLAYRGIADIYGEAYNPADQLLYARREHDAFTKSGRQPYLRYATLDLASALCSAAEYDEALRLASQTADTALAIGDGNLLAEAMRLKALTHFSRDSFDEAREAYAALCALDNATPDDSLYLALSSLGAGRTDEALRTARAVNEADPVLASYFDYRYRMQAKEWKEAITAAERYDSLATAVFMENTSRNLQSVVADDLARHYRLARTQLRNSRLQTAIIIIFAALALLIIVAIASEMIARQRRKTEEILRLADDLQFTLAEVKSAHTRSTASYRKLMTSKYSLLEEVCNIGIHTPSPRMRSRRLNEYFDSLIEKLSVDDKTLEEMGAEADLLYDNVYSDFRRDLPGLKDADYRLFLFSIHNFSSTAIQVFLKEEKAVAVYNRKYRLKDKIRTLPADRQRRYLPFLS